MGKRMTGNGFIDEFADFYEVNQLAKNLSDLYYIANDGTSVYMHSLLSFADRFMELKEPLVYYRGIIVPSMTTFSVAKNFKKTKMDAYTELRMIEDVQKRVVHLEQENADEKHELDLFMTDEKCVEENHFYTRGELFQKHICAGGWIVVEPEMIEKLMDGKIITFTLKDPLDVGMMHIATTRHVMVGLKPDVKVYVKIVPHKDPEMEAKRWVLYKMEYSFCNLYMMTAHLKV